MIKVRGSSRWWGDQTIDLVQIWKSDCSLSWMAGRGAGAGRLPSDHLGDRIRCIHPIKGCVHVQERRQHSEKCAYKITKIYSIRVLHPPIIDGALQMSVGDRTPHRYPEQLATSFWLLQKCKKIKKMGTGIPPVFAFSTKLSKNSVRYRRPYTKM